MTREQRIVAIGAGSGVATMAASVAAIYHLWPVPPGLAGVADRIAFALPWGALAALPLLVGVIVVGNNRFLSEAIDPTQHKESPVTEINGRVADNTAQQVLIFLAAVLALSARLPAAQMRLVPAATLVFVVARIAFWIGYRIHPLYRAFGMAATGYLNVGLIGFALWNLVR